MITSPQNPRVVTAAKLHQRKHRKAAQRMLIEGPHLLAEALQSVVHVQVVFTKDPEEPACRTAEELGAEVVEVAPDVLARLAGTEHPRGPVAVAAIPPTPPLSARDTVVLAGVAEPGNAGTVIRSAGAFGFQVAVTPGTVDVWGPKALRAGAGGQFHIPIATVGDDVVADLRRIGLRVVSLVVAGGEPLDALGEGPVALVVGPEAPGLPPDVVEASDVRVTLPMPGGAESLNAAVAASIAMYERQRLVGRADVR